jgi:hypothetical protein
VKRLALLILFVIIIGLVAGYMFLYDHKSPQITLNPAGGPVSAAKSPLLTVEDVGTGLKHLSVTVSQGGKFTSLVDTDFKSGVHRYAETLLLGKLALKDGPVAIDIKAADRAMLSNKKELKFSLVYDSRPPVVSILTTAHNINQGGSGLVIFRVSEKVRRAGVRVGDRFFPAFLQDGDIYACMFAFPHDLKPADFLPRVVAEDMAGNEGIGGFYYHTRLRPPRFDKINISQAFLDQKMPYFQHYFPDIHDPLQMFLRVNNDLRAANIAKLKELSAKTATRPLWHGVFLRFPNSAPKAGFNDQRDYIFNGKKVDHQVHLGLDLASVAHSPVPAANSGKVVYASELGIYGQCVVIDHGLGLQSLYSHLSRIDVSVGQQVDKGKIIGQTGYTGMAGGDHLHFGMVLDGIEVDPREWLDPHWIRDNFTVKWNRAMGVSGGKK